MLKRAISRINKVSGASFLRQRALPLALLNAQRASPFSSFPKYNNRVHSLQSFSKRAFASTPDHTKLTMPALSPTMEQGNIGKWHVQVGSKVGPGDQLCDVETDKATMAFEVQDSGYIAAILVKEGTKGVPVGKLVAILVEDEADVKAFSNYKGEEGSEGAAEESGQKAQKEKKPEQKQEKQEKQQSDKKEEKTSEEKPKKKAAAKPKASTKQLPTHSKVAMPALSPTMETGKITSWQKKEGDKIEAGDVIANVETDKATIDFVYQDDGYLAKILVQEGKGSVKVGQIVAIVVDEEADVKAFKDYSGEESEGAQEEAEGQEEEAEEGGQKEETESKPKKQEQGQEAVKRASGERVAASPYAKKTAEGQNIDLSQVEGSGPGGRVLKHNVDEYAQKGGAKAQAGKQAEEKEAKETKETKKEAPKEAKAAQPKQEAKPVDAQNPYTDIPLTTVREIIAKRLLQSKTTIPHYYLETEIVMDEAMKIRETLNQSAKSKISFNDMFVKAAAHACIAVPEVNSQWHGDKIRKFKNADISVAVDTGSGLITPIVFAANTKGLNEISANTKELIEKAKKNSLKPQEFQGGTFSISNLGMMGISNFAAVINPPQSAILAISKTDKKVVFVDGAPKTVNVMNVTLSCDHRVIDGAVGARWLEAFKNYLEKPLTLLL